MLTILIGLPGSGKSTYAQECVKQMENCVWLSSDNIREEVLTSVEDQADNDLVFNLMFERTIENLKLGNDVIYDATNVSSKRRRELIKQIRKEIGLAHEIIAVMFAIPFKECVKRNEERERSVPYGVIDRMYKRFEVATTAEGFDYVLTVTDKNLEKADRSKVVMDLVEYNQDSPYHDFTLGNHMFATYLHLIFEKIRGGDFSGVITELEMAGWLHDIGKPHCKTFKNTKGEDSEIAHYYGHENVSAYDILCMDLQGLDNVKVAFLVQNHMRMYSAKSPKAIKKLKSLMSEETFEQLWKLHIADKRSHKIAEIDYNRAFESYEDGLGSESVVEGSSETISTLS